MATSKLDKHCPLTLAQKEAAERLGMGPARVTTKYLMRRAELISRRIEELLSQQLPLTSEVFAELGISPPTARELRKVKKPEICGVIEELGAEKVLWLSAQLQALLGCESPLLIMLSAPVLSPIAAALRALDLTFEIVRCNGNIRYKVDFPETIILPENATVIALLDEEGKGIVTMTMPIAPEKQDAAEQQSGKMPNSRSIKINIVSGCIILTVDCSSTSELPNAMRCAEAIAKDYA
jgi:hypothetical protein